MPPDSQQSIQIEMRKIPSVSAVLQNATDSGIFTSEPGAWRTTIIRNALEKVRSDIGTGNKCPDLTDIMQDIRYNAGAISRDRIRKVLNATGIPLHTNLGRAPIPAEIFEKAKNALTGYCNLEMDLETGVRGKRGAALQSMLKAVTGADSAACVNNGAAAVYLLLLALAKGKEVIISRSELVQIGGGFRIPDILAESGAVLREIGTTNITTISDYENAITADTCMILKVHRSNFVISGHTEEPSLRELSELAERNAVTMAMDLGSGAFVPWHGHDLQQEPTVQDVLRSGVHIVTMSGDKLVGGAQAGIALGRTDLIEKLVKHPMYRAMRTGRLTMVILEEVMAKYMAGEHATLTTWQMIDASFDELKVRHEKFSNLLRSHGISNTVVELQGTVGGGAAPGKSFTTPALAIIPKNHNGYLTTLRSAELPIIPRIEKDVVFIDLRCISPDEEGLLLAALCAAGAK